MRFKIFRLVAISSFLFLFNTIYAQTAENKSSLLWEISGNGLTQPSYLFGTIHLISKNDFYVRPAVDSVFALSEQVAFEIKLDDFAALMQLEQKMNLPEDVTISSLMNSEDYEKLRKYFADSLQTDITTMNNKKPLALQQILLYSAIDGETESFELYFLMKCMTQKKPIKGLETINVQLDIFDSIPYTEQLQWLVDGIEDTVQMDTLWNTLTENYKLENLDKIAELILKSAPEIMAYENLFLSDRNKNWIPVIENLIAEKTTFIAVGAGHLPFDTGVIQLLINKGYTLKAL